MPERIHDSLLLLRRAMRDNSLPVTYIAVLTLLNASPLLLLRNVDRGYAESVFVLDVGLYLVVCGLIGLQPQSLHIQIYSDMAVDFYPT